MERKSVVLTLILSFSIFINCSLKIQQPFNCDNKNSLAWLWNLRNSNRCLNVITTSEFIPKCFFDKVFNSKFVIQVHSLTWIQFRNILSIGRTNCDNFMIFTRNNDNISELFRTTKLPIKRFLPFSQLFLVASDFNIELDASSLNYIYENGLYVFVLQTTLYTSFFTSFHTLHNVLTQESLNLTISNRNDAIRYFGTYQNHPVLHSRYKQKVFRVSLFNCLPYVVYLPNGAFDGLEYRVLEEITKNWTIQHIKCDTSEDISDPYGMVRGQVQNLESDLAMCSVWLNTKSNDYLDVTFYINFECGTFLVPSPSLLNPAIYLFVSIGLDVWSSFLISLVGVSIIFTMLAKFGRNLMENSWKDLNYVLFSRSFMDALKVIVSQGLGKFPKENSIRALFNSWIITSLLFGVVFSTGYTSLLTKPPYSKPVDSVEDFLDLLYKMGGKSNVASALNDTGVDIFMQLAKRAIDDNEEEKGKVAKKNDVLAYFVKTLSNNYITYIDHETDPELKLRIMRSCFFNHYTVLALQKYSTHTQFFNEKIGILQQSGLISHWASSIQGAGNNYMRPYFQKIFVTRAEPKKISLKNLSSSFWLLFAGLCTATIVFVVEHLQIYWIRR